MSRAFIFTMDAVLALIPVFILVGTVSTFSGGETIHMQAQSMDMAHRSVDTFAVLEKQGNLDEFALMFANYSKLRDDSDATWQNERNSLLILINSTLNPMIPDDFGYGVDFLGTYENGTEYTDLEFTSDNRTLTGPTQRPYESESESIDVAFKMVSGYEKERPITGCIARATIVDMSKTTKKVISINPQGGGWDTNDVDIETRFEIPTDANITNATFYVSLHYDPPINTLTVNGNDVTGDIVTLYSQAIFFGIYGYGFFGRADVTPHVTTGTNVVNLAFTNTGSWHAHTHPGMRLEVTYETSTSQADDLTQRFNFDKTTGRTGAWQIMDFHVPTGAVVSSATLYLHAEGIDERYTIDVNGNTLVSATGVTNTTYDNISDITSYVQAGTNVISAYFDASGENTQYGAGSSEISNESYVEVVYTSLPQSTFGYLDLTRTLQFGGSASDPKQTSFQIPSTHDTILESFTTLAQLTSLEIEVEAWKQGDAPTTVFTSPTTRAVPAKVFINPAIFQENTTNYIEAADIDCACDFLPESLIEYTYLVPSQVSFGSIFDACVGHTTDVYYDVDEDEVQDGFTTLPGSVDAFVPDTDGKDDAVQRLLNELNTFESAGASINPSGHPDNPIDVELTSIEFTGEDIGDVPFMWGPLKVRMRVWQ